MLQKEASASLLYCKKYFHTNHLAISILKKRTAHCMNNNILRLYQIAQKQKRTIIGLMSGTSFDGLDIALCEFEGSGHETIFNLKHFITKEYTPAFKEQLKSVFAKASVSLEKVTLLNEYIGIYYAQLIKECLQEWEIPAAEVDIIASHGQTIFHSPKQLRAGKDPYANATLQIGDGDHIAVHTGIITISDFRQKHIAAGGEGAPLAAYGDFLLFSGTEENRILLNIGGIANFTFIPKDSNEKYFPATLARAIPCSTSLYNRCMQTAIMTKIPNSPRKEM